MEGNGDAGPDGYTPNSTYLDAAMDLDFMDELLFEGCWLETNDGLNYMQPGPSTSNGLDEFDTVPFSVSSHQMYHGETETPVSPRCYMTIEDLSGSQSLNGTADGSASSLSQPGSFIVQGTELGSRWWIGPSTGSGSSSSVKERLMQAVGYLKESTKDRDVLIQIWVPIKREGKHVLTTEGQPYSLNTNCKSLEIFRDVSKSYNFPAEEDSKESVGLPGRVFLGKLPEWTPDVRFFRRDEYPRISFAQEYNVGGSLALPVFEGATGTCLGVVELVTTTQKINYRPELEHVCKALEAVDLRSSPNFTPPNVEACNELYQAALTELAEVLRSVCKAYKLPLALTWAPCLSQGKNGCRHSDENFYHCVSTVDAACFVADKDFSDFLEACSEHHLFRGQGVVGRAFTTNKQCFATDITVFSKTNYPLSHHARMFGLRGAVAIPLQSIFTRSVEFVLELFLPKDCLDSKAQKQMLNSLSSFMQQACQSLHVVVDKDLEEEVILPVKEVAVLDGRSDKEIIQFKVSSLKGNSLEESSWIAHMMEAQQKGKGVSVSWEYQKEEPKEEFKVTTHWEDTKLDLHNKQILSDFQQLDQNAETKASVEGDGGDSVSSGGHYISANKRAGEKRRTKMEKTISLEVLRQYFAGSLKDAAKSIGVCPTTLKRICRQHGITRWPSRKIKKVGHSLKKLQLVIDSVQGAEGAIQIGSFYSSFPELSSPNLSGNGPSSSFKISNRLKPSEPLQGAAAPKSPHSSCSQSSGSTTCLSTEAKQHNTSTDALCNADGLMVEDPGGVMKRAHSHVELHSLNQEETKLLARSQSHITFNELPTFETLPPLPKSGGQNFRARGAFRVKATFGEVNIRFRLQPSWGFTELQQEIVKRFSIEDVSRMDLKYLDDDSEWVLLTCDADLEECIDIHKSFQSHTIKISLHQASHPNLGSSFGSSAPL
ncbi:Protein NLP2 [Hibiscus syriacus]|uniref:Protein NLP2 n=1 Tax=Hibiscus syriacus TaxID=106335 RepID=A0A6A2ZGF3_HIBSY|nr:protein NLP2-like [Hibiscus syriacus]XP_039015181.1 protein NLP2-like [Hibiscus syriacus]XP_039015182.1 protein NLP2-like [Hibiscus syriacus]KAE8690707.1 Protein NLP2 [Hibiscus syriacus]